MRGLVMIMLATPTALCSAFVPGRITGISCPAASRQPCTKTNTSLDTRSTAIATGAPRSSMNLEAGAEGGSRGEFLRKVSEAAVSVAAATAGFSVGAHPALADSTGKYSSKATAKKRYLPRVAKAVKAFAQLRKDIDSGSASSSAAFFTEVLPDSIPAMDLYGSSMKRGEAPDSKSRALQQLAQDFGSAAAGVGKSLGKKGADPAKAYDNAAKILEQYLKGTELDPIGSASYD